MTEEAQLPPFLRPFVVPHDHVVTETRDDVDYYLPTSSERAGAVVLLHGGPIAEDRPVGPREWPAYVGYGSLLASSGVVAAVLEHGFREPDEPRSSDRGRAPLHRRRAATPARRP